MMLSLAYHPLNPADMVGLPDWASRDFYDVSATASLQESGLTGWRDVLVIARLERPTGN